MNHSLTKTTQLLNQEWPRLRAEYHLETLAVFGSYLKNEQKPDSDIDLLVTFSETPTLLEFVRKTSSLTYRVFKLTSS